MLKRDTRRVVMIIVSYNSCCLMSSRLCCEYKANGSDSQANLEVILRI